MKLRTRLDVFSAALLSALGTAQLVACGGNAAGNGFARGGSGGGGSGNAGVGGTSTAGANTGGAPTAGAGGDNTPTAGAGKGTAGGRATGGQSGAPTAGTGGGAGAPGSAGAGPIHQACINPKDIGDGFEQCDGFKHRPQAGTCASHVPNPKPLPEEILTVKECLFDADCKDHPYGWCTAGQNAQTYCEYGCVIDSDCAANQLCDCVEPVGRCVVANCRTDADCTNGLLCRAYDATSGCGPIVYTCQTPADTCGNDHDCLPSGSTQGLVGDCNFDAQANRFQCTNDSCAIGRPFLVEGWQRLASVAGRADWIELARQPLLADLDAMLCVQLTEQWTRVALMEHASIAAFARFTLQLLSLGAPAELIERATAAMLDETKHAKACFAVASAYAGAPLGPKRLSVERCLDESSLQEIVLNTIREGCVGETVAAIEAREAAEHATDPALRELLLVISEDETRHAQLAYRFVQWALTTGGPELERAVEREFAALAAEAQTTRSALTAAEQQLLLHGVVPDALRAAIRGQAIAEVILPCSRALFRAETPAARFATSNA